MYVLAIDGGGTKTSGVICDEFGTIYAKMITKRTNPTAMDITLFKETLHGLLQALQGQNPEIFSSIEICFAGMAGVKETNTEGIVEEIFREYIPKKTSIVIENDAIIALYTGTLGYPGIVQIAGTGSITMGYDPTYSYYRVGGWGYLFDDEGSGYDFGVQALKAVFQSYDKREKATKLTDAILAHFAVVSVPELIQCVYSKEHPRTVIAPLSRYVMVAAGDGDDVANRILEEGCHKLFHAITTCYHQLTWSEPSAVPVVLTGGVISNASYFIPKFERLAQQEQLPLQFIAPSLQPIGGAAVGALARMGKLIHNNFTENFSKNYGG
ncbi:N-acetylglucosamine kinase [Lysinibacillus sp. 54212]|uniref:N-acetylglucosamine kinase n=1 Tax=Lysinibacillus sp. 54212 TaxID=3119829 RepID=UPI002FCB1499